MNEPCPKCGRVMLERDDDFYCMDDDPLIDKRTRREIVPSWTRNKIRDSSQSAAQAQFYTRRNLVSKSVYDGYARLVGTVRDLGYSQSGQAAILVEVQGQEIWMPLSDVAETVDIILLKKGTIIAARDGTVVF